MPLLPPAALSERVIQMLVGSQAKYRLMQHAPEGSCEAVSILRGNHPREAVKAMLLRVKESLKTGHYALALLPGDAKADFNLLKAEIEKSLGKQIRSIGMADKKDVIGLLDSEPGGVSPFSFHKDVYVILDAELTKTQNVFFSAGKTDESVTMPTADFMRVSLERGAKVYSFCELPKAGDPYVYGPAAVAAAPAAAEAAAVAERRGSLSPRNMFLPPPVLPQNQAVAAQPAPVQDDQAPPPCLGIQ